MRLDAWLVESGAVRSRERAKEAIAAGLVRINGAPAAKSSQKISPSDRIECDGEVHNYVSRGALKLIAGLDHFGVDPTGLICLDLGASTGGFTEVLLERGAAKVYAVDVGHGQLHESLRSDARVINLEGVHAKSLTRHQGCRSLPEGETISPLPPGEVETAGAVSGEGFIPDAIDLVVCDVSFISIMKALPYALDLCAEQASLVSLVKPQFELGPDHIGKGGLVTMPLEDQRGWIEGHILPFITGLGWQVTGLIESPIKGGDGNTEFLLGASHAQ